MFVGSGTLGRSNRPTETQRLVSGRGTTRWKREQPKIRPRANGWAAFLCVVPLLTIQCFLNVDQLVWVDVMRIPGDAALRERGITGAEGWRGLPCVTWQDSHQDGVEDKGLRGLPLTGVGISKPVAPSPV
jgi:hypothetical protein